MDGPKKIPLTIKTAFSEITEYFIKDKYVDVYALSTDNDSNDPKSNFKQISYIEVMTFYLIAEYMQSEKLAGHISTAIDAYIQSPDSTISTSNLDKNININLDSIYFDFNKVLSAFSASLNTSIKTKLDINTDNKREHVIFFLNLLYRYIEDDNKELFLSYIPSIIFSFHMNYKKGISGCIKNLIKQKASQPEILKIKNFLTTIPKCIPKYQLRDNEKKVQKSVNFFLFTSLYNIIIVNYRKNFIIDFLWFERNVGFYQYYLTAAEYSQVINYISYFEPTDSILKTDISIPTALFLYFKDNILKETPKDTNNEPSDYTNNNTSNDANNDSKPLWKILDRIINNKFPNDDILNIFKKVFLEKEIAENLYLDYNDIIAYFNRPRESNISPFKNRFIIHTVQFIYYNELLNKKGFVKQDKYGCGFHCDEITDETFKLKDVDFNLWLTSDDLADMEFNIINIDNKYYTVSPILTSISPCGVTLSLDDSIISVTKAKEIRLNGNLIKKGAEAVLNFKNVTFNNLSIKFQETNYDEIINYFTSKDIVESFSKINSTNISKIYVFLGLNYFTNIEVYPQGRKNITSLYINRLMGYQNFFPIRENFNIDEIYNIIKRYIRIQELCCGTVIGGISDLSCSSCSGSGYTKRKSETIPKSI